MTQATGSDATKASAPADLRGMFQLFSTLDIEKTLHDFFGNVEWESATSYQIYQIFLNRLPDSTSSLRNIRSLSKLEQAISFFCSPEFQTRLIELVLTAYPEKRRLFHLHVPKSAGVDLREILVKLYPFVHYNHTQRDSTSPLALAAHLKMFSDIASRSDSILVSGHMPLIWYLKRGLIRYSDYAFSVLRHPKDSIISLVNYYLRRIDEDPKCLWPDTKSYADYLGVKEFSLAMSHCEKLEIAEAMFRNKSMMQANLLTHMLGCGTADTAIELVTLSNTEIIPLHSYASWLKLQWGIESNSQRNKTFHVITATDISKDTEDYINDYVSEDVKLFDILSGAIERRGRGSIFGHELLESL
ncbi:MAG: hypothetical protein P4M05_31880 [Bradyrhizobium sp.]|nr:hypothetical protein [Bradyrhizobium sp.]